ncbi:hypothetical protein BKA56DRAFT_603039 [Ilyonectria sp. MPI-CAGE-AT-0026]|nr:hypothetical protein BKA56DRAFT_603039 [Ilyonectria sp. MPI-CAGE-AT-0026]
MGVVKTTIQPGSGPSPQVGQKVIMDYTGFLKDPTKPENKGDQFDTSIGRGDFITAIGVGRVIRGWDEGVPQMQVGEKAILDMTADYGYGARGAPGAIPPNADLIFEVHLKGIQ